MAPSSEVKEPVVREVKKTAVRVGFRREVPVRLRWTEESLVLPLP